MTDRRQRHTSLTTLTSRASDPYHRPGFGGHKGHVATEALASHHHYPYPGCSASKEQMRSSRFGSFSVRRMKRYSVTYSQGPRTDKRLSATPPKAQPRTPTQRRQGLEWRRVDLAKPSPLLREWARPFLCKGPKVTSKGNIQQGPLSSEKALNIP